MYYALIYETVADYVAKRAPYRDEHLRLARESHNRGEMILGGAFAEPADGALLIFKGDSAAVAEDFALNDPYVKAGIILKWRVRPWNVVIGGTQ